MRVLSIDPGRAKCGIAILNREGEVLFRGIVAADRIVEETLALNAAYTPDAILVGAGTGSRPVLLALQQVGLSALLHCVDESYTSEAARKRFVGENPPKGWRRLLPHSLRTPDRPYDDYVAIILAERWIKNSGH